MTVARTVSLAGTLDVLLTDGFVPAPGDEFEIIAATGILGRFAVESLPTLPGGLEWFVNYSAESVQLISTFAGDFDFDGNVDAADFLAWQRGESPSPLSSSDLGDWEKNFGANPSAITALSNVAPEPATFAILLAGCSLMGAVARRR